MHMLSCSFKFSPAFAADNEIIWKILFAVRSARIRRAVAAIIREFGTGS